jgi:hypothetical protein
VSDAQYVIDVSAQMNGQETLSQLDALTSKLQGGGKNAEVFQSAIAKVGQDLNVAKVAATEANAALAEGSKVFDQLEKSANKASKAAEKAGLKNAGVVPFDMASKAAAATAALDHQTHVLSGLEAEAKAATAAEEKLLATQKNAAALSGHASKSAAQQASELKKLSYAFGQAGGPIGGLARGFLGEEIAIAKLTQTMGASNAQLVLFGIGTAAVVAGLAIGSAAALVWGVSLADSNRNAALATEAMQAMHPELKALAGTIADVAKDTDQSVASLEGLEVSLKAAHVSAADMPAALRAAADAESALGKGGAQEFVDKIKAGTKSVKVLAAETQASLGGIVAKQMMGLGAQTDRLKANFAGTFGGLNIDPLLSAFSVLVGLFDQNTASGQALKFVFEGLFQPIIDFAPKAATEAEALFLALEIGGLKAYLAVRPWIPWIEDFGEAIALAAGVFALTFVPALVTGAAAAVAAFAPLVVAAVVAAAPFIALVAAAFAVVEAFKHWDQITAIVSGVFGSIVDLGSNLISGLVAGIAAGAGAVIGAIGGVVTGAIDHAKHLLGIASPSKVFAGIGDNTVAGFTGAVDDGAGDAQAAMAGMVMPDSPEMKQAALSGDLGAMAALSSPTPSAPAQAAAAPAASSGAGKYQGLFDGATFNLSGDNAQTLAEQVIEIVTRALEGNAAQMGAQA